MGGARRHPQRNMFTRELTQQTAYRSAADTQIVTDGRKKASSTLASHIMLLKETLQ
jgi:hypothetical protein